MWGRFWPLQLPVRQCTRRVSGITVIRYAQYQNIGKQNNVKVFGSNKAKGINRRAKIGQIVVCPFVRFRLAIVCLFCFDIRILITSLVSSNSSCHLCLMGENHSFNNFASSVIHTWFYVHYSPRTLHKPITTGIILQSRKGKCRKY